MPRRRVPFRVAVPVAALLLASTALNAGSATVLVTRSYDGKAAADADCIARDVSANGRYVLFESAAQNLDAATGNSANNLYVRDVSKGKLLRVNAALDGEFSGNPSTYGTCALTPSGRHVLFGSPESLLVQGDAQGTNDVFVRDLRTATTTLVSANSAGAPAGQSAPIAFSPDARYVLFQSTASDLVAGKGNGRLQAYVRDLVTGTTTLVSVASGTSDPSTGDSFAVAVSPDGRFVLFDSDAGDLTPGGTKGRNDVYLRDLVTGTTSLVSVNAAGTAGGSAGSDATGMTPDGRYVLFQSFAADLAADDTNGASDVFVRDLATGTTTLVSRNAAGSASGHGGSFPHRISLNGRYVLFGSTADDLSPLDANTNFDLYLRDMTRGTTEVITLNAARTAASNGTAFAAVMTPTGSRVAFESSATDLVTADADPGIDVFVRDRKARRTRIASVRTDGKAGANAASSLRALTPNGRTVVFQSAASDLSKLHGPAVVGDLADVYLRRVP